MLDAGIADQHVQPAVQIDQPVDRRPRGLDIGNVDGEGLDRQTGRAQRRRRTLERVLVAAIDHDMRAVLRQGLGHRQAQAARCAGHQGDLARQGKEIGRHGCGSFGVGSVG